MESQEAVAVLNSGIVRVNMLSNLEALINLAANSFELVAIALGAFVALAALFAYRRSLRVDPLGLGPAKCRAHFGFLLVKVGLVLPPLINWFVASARDAALFN